MQEGQLTGSGIEAEWGRAYGPNGHNKTPSE